MPAPDAGVYRILDANCNRLREALRVSEEYFRFIMNLKEPAIALKQLRHALVSVEKRLGQEILLQCRDTGTDCFSGGNRPEEMCRGTTVDLLRASFKRAQEAARSIEEYAKLTETPEVSENAKQIRFTLYQLEQRHCRISNNG